MALDLSRYGEPLKTGKLSLDLTKYGTPTESFESPSNDGFFKSVYKSLASPVVNLIARPGQAVQALAGKEVSSGKFLGLDITNPMSGKDVLRDVGRGLETVSLGVGAGGLGVVKAGFKSSVVQGFKEGAKIGLKSSPLFSVGASLEEGDTDIRSILKRTAIDTATGTLGSGILGGTVPAIAGSVGKFTKKGLRDELGSIYRDTAAKYVKPQAILDNASQVNKTDPVAVLQMYGNKVVPEMKGGGAQTEEGQAFLKKKISELSNLRNDALFMSDERVPLAGYKQYANELLDAQSWSESKKAIARKDLNKIIDDIDKAYKGSPKNPDGAGIDLNELTTVKSEQTGLSKSYNNKAPKFDYDAHGIAGKAARDLVELLTDNNEVKDLNKLIQGHYDAIDFLDALNGKKVHGGTVSKLAFKLGGDVIGAVAGGAAGNPIVGGVAGHVIAGKIADIVQNKFITNPIKSLLIKNLQEQAPKEVKAVLKSLESKYKAVFDDIFPDGYSLPRKSASNASPMKNEATTTSKNGIPKQSTPKVDKSSEVVPITGKEITKKSMYPTIHEGGKVKMVEGEPVKIIDGVDTFIHQDENGNWVVSEATTGRNLTGGGFENRNFAIKDAKTNIENIGEEKFLKLIEENRLPNKEGGSTNFDVINKGAKILGAGAALIQGASMLPENKVTYTKEEKITPKVSKKKDLGEVLMQLESSGGKDKGSADEGELKWLTGLTEVAIKELARTGIKKTVNINDKEDVLDASVKYFNLLKKRNPTLTDAEVYADKYWTQWKNMPNPQKARGNAIKKFNDLLDATI